VRHRSGRTGVRVSAPSGRQTLRLSQGVPPQRHSPLGRSTLYAQRPSATYPLRASSRGPGLPAGVPQDMRGASQARVGRRTCPSHGQHCTWCLNIIQSLIRVRAPTDPRGDVDSMWILDAREASRKISQKASDLPTNPGGRGRFRTADIRLVRASVLTSSDSGSRRVRPSRIRCLAPPGLWATPSLAERPRGGCVDSLWIPPLVDHSTARSPLTGFPVSAARTFSRAPSLSCV